MGCSPTGTHSIGAANALKREQDTFELLGKHRADSIVAFGGAGTKTAADLLADAARISRGLPEAFPNSQALLVFEHDRYAMAAALLGALDRGHSVALPPNGRRDSILAVHDQPETAIVIHDTDAGFPIAVSSLLNAKADESEVSLVSPIIPHAGVIATVYTSGTTGPMTPWRKTRAELLGEAASLGTTFEVETGAKIVGTIPPGHIYGLLFTILLPLLRGAAFSRETPHHAEAIARCVQEHEADTLVTVPVQLRALDALPAGSLPSLRRVFSSTGPLPDAVATSFCDRFDISVTEILGSTETGGIASRRRRSGETEAWRPFDGVDIFANDAGRLEVDSLFVHADLPHPFETADLVEIHADGSFTHLGRSDGIVKIGGRRVSVPEVEDCLRQHSDVADVAVVAVPAEGGRGTQLLAAVVRGSSGEALVMSELTASLKQALRGRFDSSSLPRRFVYVDTLPKEANGKTPRDRLLRIFDLQPNGAPVNWVLEWGVETVEQDEAGGGQTLSLEIPVRIPEDYAWFEGHFEDYPVLAGAVQLKELILPTISRAFPELHDVTAMNRIKFSGRIVPGDSILVRVERGTKPGRVRFEIRKPGEVCARGSLTLSESVSESASI